jgi:hypothetical protein
MRGRAPAVFVGRVQNWYTAAEARNSPAGHRQEAYAMARLGADARLEQIAAEAAAIRAAFPHLASTTRPPRHRRRQVKVATPRPARPAAKTTPKRRKGPKMSPAARKAVPERMKRYWAARRQAKAQAPAETGQSAAESPQTGNGTTVQQAPAKGKVSAKPRATKRRTSRKARRSRPRQRPSERERASGAAVLPRRSTARTPRLWDRPG